MDGDDDGATAPLVVAAAAVGLPLVRPSAALGQTIVISPPAGRRKKEVSVASPRVSNGADDEANNFQSWLLLEKTKIICHLWLS